MSPHREALPRLAPTDAVRGVTDSRRQIIRVVPPLDDAEIVVDEERGAADPVGQNQRGGGLAAGKLGGADRAHTEPAPFLRRTLIFEPGEPAVEIARHGDLAAPALLAAPAEP